MKVFLSLVVMSGAIVLSSSFALAGELVGPRGSTANGNAVILPNRQGGYSGYGQGAFTGVSGSSSNGEIRFQTTGDGEATYDGNANITSPNGQSATMTTSGDASYNQISGYSGQNTTTINGTTYNSTSSSGTTTITSPNGSRTVNYRLRR
jgi:hypothetical protein